MAKRKVTHLGGETELHYKRRQNILRQISRAEKRGYTAPEGLRESLKSKSTKELGKFDVYKELVFKKGKELIEGAKRRIEEVKQAAKKAAKTRKERKEKQETERYRPKATVIMYQNLLDIIRNARPMASNMMENTLNKAIKNYGLVGVMKSLDMQGEDILATATNIARYPSNTPDGRQGIIDGCALLYQLLKGEVLSKEENAEFSEGMDEDDFTYNPFEQ